MVTLCSDVPGAEACSEVTGAGPEQSADTEGGNGKASSFFTAHIFSLTWTTPAPGPGALSEGPALSDPCTQTPISAPPPSVRIHRSALLFLLPQLPSAKFFRI